MKKQLLFSFLITLISIVTSFAQVTTSKIQGVVNDETSTGLFGANVVAKHMPTGTVAGTMTLEGGRFTIPNLRVGGPYTITISYVGYKTVEYTGVYLDLGKAFDLNVQLANESEILDEVVITGGKSSTFNNDRTGAETSVGKRELTTLPSISRSSSDFTRLDPSASGGSFGGRNDQFNNFTLDGSIFNNPFGLDAATPGGQTDSQPVSLDAIEQISVATAPYDVTLSGFTGASVNAVTKSGTNEFTGTVYGYFRNQDFTGDKIKGEDIYVPKLEQTQFGASIGGPIIKNKLFFFANFESDDREDLGQTWLPNRGTGSINESRVMESDLMAVQQALLNAGYDPGAYEGFMHKSKSTKGIFKLDWNINEKHRLALIYNFLDASKDKPGHPTALISRGPSASTLQFQNSGYQINNNLNSFLAELNSTFSDKITNKLQVGYSYFDDYRNPFSTPAPIINILEGGSNYIVAGHEAFSINNKLDQKVYQITDNLNYFSGDHVFTAGFSFEKFAFKNSFNLTGYENFGTYGTHGGYYGTFGPYPSVAAFLEDAQDPNGILAANLIYAQSVYESSNAAGDGKDGGWKLSESNVGQFSFYLQDDWSVSDKFKLSYGIRFDQPLYFNTDDLIKKYMDTENGATRDQSVDYYDPSNGKAVKLISTKLPTDDVLISPRVGFNWDVKGDKTLQIRGGSGLFTGRFPFVWLGNQVSGADDGFLQIVDPDFEWPQVWRTSLGVDKKFENGIIATIDLAYTKDINGAHVQNWGLKSPTGTLAGVDNRAYYLASDKVNNAYVFTNSDKGRTFNSTFKIQKTFENGWFTSLAYNYLDSKDVNSIEAEITGDAFAFNPVVGDANKDVRSYSKYGDTHRIIGVASKAFTYGNRDEWTTSIATFFEYAKGGRFNYTYGGDINGDGSSANDLLYVPTASEISQMQFSGAGQAEAFEKFIQQDDYLKDRRGNYVERYGATSPWRSRWDVKIMQDYKIKVSDDKTNTIQFSIDILNFGNLINSDWGLVQQPRNLQPVGVTVDAETQTPTYTFDPSLQKTFAYDSSLLSRWQMQFGLRYIF